MLKRSVCLLLLCIPLLSVSPAPARPMHEQLRLFHWWNACPENEPWGPDATRLPIHEGGLVDGRSGFQWVKAVIDYLDYRAGSAWRPGTHRYHPVRQHYVECAAIVQHAYFSNVNWWAPCALPTTTTACAPIPRSAPISRKKPQAVVAPSRAKSKKAGTAA